MLVMVPVSIAAGLVLASASRFVAGDIDVSLQGSRSEKWPSEFPARPVSGRLSD